MLVPNRPPPVDPGPLRLAIVGESPGLEESTWRLCEHGHGYPGQRWSRGQIITQTRCPHCASPTFTVAPRPFVGPSGRLLDDCLVRAGFHPDRAFRGNVSLSGLKGDELHDPARLDLAHLSDDLMAFKPNCVLLLGNAPLRAFHPWHWRGAEGPPEHQADDLFGPVPDKATKRRGEFAIRISDWRGSIFEGHLPISGGWSGKCVAAYHPAAVLRSGPQAPGAAGSNPEWLPLLRFDIKRAVEEAASSTMNLPERWFWFPAENQLERVKLL